MALTRITKGVIKPNENYDTHNINSTGIVTAIGLDVNGNGDISGNLNVGGVLTYEDVTSIDSVGIITARNGIDCNGDIDVDGHTNLDNVSIAGVTTFASNIYLGDNDRIYLGADNDMILWNDGSNGLLYNNTGNFFIRGAGGLTIQSNSIRLRNDGNTEDLAKFTANGSVELYHNNIKRFETSSVGVSIPQDLDVDGHTNLDNVSIAGVTTMTGNLTINSSSNSRAIILPDNKRIYFGDGEDFWIGSNGSNGEVSGSLYYYNHQYHYDNVYARFGHGADLNIFHNGTNSIIDNNTGSLLIDSTDNIIFETGSSTERLRIDSAGNMSLGKGADASTAYTRQLQIHSTDTSGAALHLTNSTSGSGNSDGFHLVQQSHIYYWLREDAHQIFATNGVERLRITAAGQMVMGATTSRAKFEIKDNGYTSTSVLQRISADDANPYALIVANDTLNTNSNSGLQIFVSDSGTHFVRARGSSTASNNNLQLVAQNDVIFNSGSSEQERLRITSGGLIGINNTSPNLSGGGDGIHIASSGAAEIHLTSTTGSTSTDGLSIQMNGSTANFINRESTTRFFTGGAASSNERLRITSDGKVGINESSPNSVFHVKHHNNNSADITIEGGGSGNAGIQFIPGGQTNTYFAYVDTNRNFRIQDYTSEKLRIVSGGKVLIGDGTTYSPQGLLHIVGDDNSNGPELYLQVPNNNTTDNIGALVFGNNVDKSVVKIQGVTHTANNTGDLTFHTSTTGTMTEKLRITSAGRLGVGVASPVSILHLHESGSNGAPIIQFSNGDTGTTTGDGFAIGMADNESPFIYNRENTDLRIGTNNIERLRITSAGRIGIHQSSPDAASLHIGNSIASTGSNVALQVGTISGQNRYLVLNNFHNQQNFYQIKARVNDNQLVPVLDVGNPYGSTGHGTKIKFSGYGDNEVAAIEVVNAASNSSSAVDMVLKAGGTLPRLTLKNNGEIVTHQLAGSEKAYPLVMGTGTVAQNTNMSGHFNYHDVRGCHNTSNSNYSIGGWVWLGSDYGPAPYPVRRFKIAAPGGFSNGTIVYQVWHDGDSNYDYGGLWEIRINCWTGSSRFESVAFRCVNGKRDDLKVFAYDDSNGIMIQTSSIWGRVFIRKAGWDDHGRNPGSSYCAVANNAALAIYNSQGTDDGAIPSGGFQLYTYPEGTGGRDLENSNNFNG